MRRTPRRGRIAAAVLLPTALAAIVGLAACGAPASRGGPAAAEGVAVQSGDEPAPAADGARIAARDGVLLRVHAWEPGGPARGIVLMVPGVTGLEARMEGSVTDPLSAAGFAVYALEPRGTGGSGGARGYAGNASLILDDLGRFAAWGRERGAGLPVFVFGHSMGGTFALALAAGMERPPAGLILVNPAYKYRPLRGATPGFGDYLRFAAYWIFAPRKPVVDMGGDPSLLEDPDDRAEAAERKASPSVQGLQSMASMIAARKIMGAAPRNAARLSVPVLILEGSRDLLIDPAGTDDIAAAWGGPGVERLQVDGAHGRSSTLAGMDAIIGWLTKESGR